MARWVTSLVLFQAGASLLEENRSCCCVTPQLFIFISIYVVSFFLAVKTFSSKMILLQFKPFFIPPTHPFSPHFQVCRSEQRINKGFESRLIS